MGAELQSDTVSQLKNYDQSKQKAVSALVMRDLGFSEKDRAEVSMHFFHKKSGTFSSTKSAFDYGPNVVRGNFVYGKPDEKIEFLLNISTKKLLIGQNREEFKLNPGETLKDGLKRSSVRETEYIRLRVDHLGYDSNMVCVAGNEVTKSSNGSFGKGESFKICQTQIGAETPPTISKEEVEALFPGRHITSNEKGGRSGTVVLTLDRPMELEVPIRESRLSGAPKGKLGDLRERANQHLSEDGLGLDQLKRIAVQSRKLNEK